MFNRGLPEDKFLDRCKELQPHLTFKMYGYVNASQPATFICQHCGYTTERTRAKSIWYTKVCKGCVGKSDFRNNLKPLRDMCKSWGCELLTDKYIDEKYKMDLLFSCGHTDSVSWSQLREKFKRGVNVCNTCGNQIANKKRELKIPQMNDKLKSHSYGRFKLKNHWKSDKGNTRMDVECLDCGRVEKDMCYHSFLKRNSGCICRDYDRNSSSGERLMNLLFDDLNVDYERQKYFQQLPEKVFYDFYLPYYNILIEYDGEQHSKPKQAAKDSLKNKYAEILGMTLYRVTYKDSLHLFMRKLDERHKIVNSKGIYSVSEDDTEGVDFDFD